MNDPQRGRPGLAAVFPRVRAAKERVAPEIWQGGWGAGPSSARAGLSPLDKAQPGTAAGGEASRHPAVWRQERSAGHGASRAAKVHADASPLTADPASHRGSQPNTQPVLANRHEIDPHGHAAPEHRPGGLQRGCRRLAALSRRVEEQTRRRLRAARRAAKGRASARRCVRPK